MAVSEVGALTREYCMPEIRTWRNNGSKRIWRLIWGAIKRSFTVH